MVKITYIGKRNYRSLRTRQGNFVGWNKGATIDVEDESLLEKLKGSKLFVRQDEIGKETGSGGIKTGVRRPKRLGRPPKAKAKGKPKKEVKPPKSVLDKTRPQHLKKPKGLKKSKRAD